MVSEVGLKTDENKPQLGEMRRPRSEAERDETPKKWGRARRSRRLGIEAAWDETHCTKCDAMKRSDAICEVRPSMLCDGDATREEAQSMTRWSWRCDQHKKSCWCWEHYGNFWTLLMDLSWGRWCSRKFITRDLSGHLCYEELVKEERQTKNICMIIRIHRCKCWWGHR